MVKNDTFAAFEQPITSEDQLNECLQKTNSTEQVYSIALFDILGFSNFVESNRTQAILDLYNKLLALIDKQKSSFGACESFAGNVVPVPVSNDWKSNVLIADANGYINVCHFSDTFIIYVNYCFGKPPFYLATPKNEQFPLLLGEPGTIQYPIMYEKHHIYLSFLQTCMDFFCQAIVAGIPLRGCISTGLAVMDSTKSIYLGSPIVEAARGETARNSLGISFGKSFNNSHPVYNDYFIPYFENIKEEKKKYLSPMVLDWARYWRNTPEFQNQDLIENINKMNDYPSFSYYYDNAINYVNFSNANADWAQKLKRDNINNIIDYYQATKEWFDSVYEPKAFL